MSTMIRNIKKLSTLICLGWVVLVLASFLMRYQESKKERERLALAAARHLSGMITITRAWNAGHGGLYAPVTEAFQPNPYLAGRLRDIKVNDLLTLTRINPSFMTRQLSDIAAQKNGVRFRITSTMPIRPRNRPTELETRYLKLFEETRVDRGEFILEGDREYYFYMTPLVTRKSCLECHAEQGYVEGDIRGGISILIPFLMKVPFLSLMAWHLLLAGCGLLLIRFGGNRLSHAYDTIQHLATIDELTGIPNRRSFIEAIHTEYKRSRREKSPLSLVMCDLDFFKQYNDAYGHTEGDRCLKAVAQKIQGVLKRPQDMCARYGGEEFVLLLPATDLAGAVTIAEQVRTAVENQGHANGGAVLRSSVTLSLGVAALDLKEMASPEDLIKKADMALYKAKRNGRNQVQS